MQHFFSIIVPAMFDDLPLMGFLFTIVFALSFAFYKFASKYLIGRVLIYLLYFTGCFVLALFIMYLNHAKNGIF